MYSNYPKSWKGIAGSVLRYEGEDMNNDWNEPKVAVSVPELKKQISDMREAYEIYEDAKDLSNEAYKKFKEKEVEVVRVLETAGLNKFNIPGLGTASLRRTYRVTCPRDLSDKRALFDYVRQAHGEDFLDTFRSINSASLNKFYNEETAAAEENGLDLKIPGLEDPIENVSISFRKETK